MTGFRDLTTRGRSRSNAQQAVALIVDRQKADRNEKTKVHFVSAETERAFGWKSCSLRRWRCRCPGAERERESCQAHVVVNNGFHCTLVLASCRRRWNLIPPVQPGASTDRKLEKASMARVQRSGFVGGCGGCARPRMDGMPREGRRGCWRPGLLTSVSASTGSTDRKWGRCAHAPLFTCHGEIFRTNFSWLNCAWRAWSLSGGRPVWMVTQTAINQSTTADIQPTLHGCYSVPLLTRHFQSLIN